MSHNLKHREWVEASCDVSVKAVSTYEIRLVVHVATDTLLAIKLLTLLHFSRYFDVGTDRLKV